jgi:hypothetical protein
MNQPKFEGIDSVYKSKADNKDIRDLLEKLVPKAKGQMVEFSKRFKGATDEQTCRNIFNYLMNHFTYLADGEEQIIKLPSALLKKKIGDCKSYSLFTASVLENLSIPYTIVYTSYNSNPIPQHVYIITQKGCIIDAVYGKFNQEKPPTFKYKKNMNVRYMAGINGNCGCSGNCGCNNGIAGKEERQAKRAEKKEVRQEKRADRKENRQETKEKIKAGLKKVGQGAKTLGLAPARAMFMTLISLNVDGFASKLSKINTTNLLNSWLKLGGDRTKLASAISKGASRPSKKLGFLPKLKQIIGNTNISGIGQTEIPAIIKTKIISLCTTAGTSIGGSPQGTATGASMGGIVVALLPSLINAIKQVPSTDLTDAPLDNLDLTSDIASETESEIQTGGGSGFSLPKNTLLYAGGALALAAGIYFATKKK